MPQCDTTLKASIVVARRVETGRGDESRRDILDDVLRFCACLYSRSVDIRFECGADLPQCLRGAIEFRLIEAATTDHHLDVAAGVVESQKSALRAGILFKRETCSRNRRVAPATHRQDTNVNDVTDTEQFLCVSHSRP